METKKDVESPMGVYETARYLGIAPNTVRNKAYKNEIPFHKPAGKMYFFKSELDEWIRCNTNKTKKQ